MGKQKRKTLLGLFLALAMIFSTLPAGVAFADEGIGYTAEITEGDQDATENEAAEAAEEAVAEEAAEEVAEEAAEENPFAKDEEEVEKQEEEKDAGIKSAKYTNIRDSAIQYSTNGGAAWISTNSIQTALNMIPANTPADQNIILITQDVSFGTATVNFPSNKNFTLEGLDADNRPKLKFDAILGYGNYWIYARYGEVIIRDLIFDGAYGEAAGPMLFQWDYRDKDFTMENCKIEGFTINKSYGSLFSQYHSNSNGENLIKFDGVEVTGITNSAGYNTYNSGIIHIGGEGARYEFVNCNFHDNSVLNNSGGVLGILDTTVPIEIKNTTFEANSAKSGGVIAVESGNQHNITLDGVTMDGNFAIGSTTSDGMGGAIYYKDGNYSYHGTLNIKNSTIENNTARIGGGIYIDLADARQTKGQDFVVLEDTTVTGNGAQVTGGGVYITNGWVSVKGDTKVTDNVCMNTNFVFADDTDVVLAKEHPSYVNHTSYPGGYQGGYLWFGEDLGANALLPTKTSGNIYLQDVKIGEVADGVTVGNKVYPIGSTGTNFVALKKDDNTLVWNYIGDNLENAAIRVTTDGGATWTRYETLNAALQSIPREGTEEDNIVELTQDISFAGGQFNVGNFTLRSSEPGKVRKVICGVDESNFFDTNGMAEISNVYYYGSDGVYYTQYTDRFGQTTTTYRNRGSMRPVMYIGNYGTNTVIEDMAFEGLKSGQNGFYFYGGLELNRCSFENFGSGSYAFRRDRGSVTYDLGTATKTIRWTYKDSNGNYQTSNIATIQYAYDYDTNTTTETITNTNPNWLANRVRVLPGNTTPSVEPGSNYGGGYAYGAPERRESDRGKLPVIYVYGNGDTSTFSANNVTVKNCDAYPIEIFRAMDASLKDVTFEDNTSEVSFGINSFAENLSISNMVVANNSFSENAYYDSTQTGAVVANVNTGDLVIENSVINNNKISTERYQYYPKGVIQSRGTTYLVNTQITENVGNICTVGLFGGDLHLMGDTVIENNRNAYERTSSNQNDVSMLVGKVYVSDNVIVRDNYSGEKTGARYGNNLAVADAASFILADNLGENADIRVKLAGKASNAYTYFGTAAASNLAGAEKIHADDDPTLYGMVRGGKLQWARSSYKITLAPGSTTNGKVAVPSAAAPGSNVTISTTPNKGFEVSKITVTPEGGQTRDITAESRFTMPEANVTVQVVFKKANSVPDSLSDDFEDETDDDVIVEIEEDDDKYAVKVTSKDPCALGYTDDGGATYHFLNKIDNDDGTYTFIIEKPIDGKKFALVKKGDANFDGKVNAVDVLLTRNFIKNPSGLDWKQQMAIDVDQDYSIDSADLGRIRSTIFRQNNGIAW